MDDKKERTLWCGNLSDKVTDDLLYELFLQAGPLENVTIPKDKDGRKRNFAFITFRHEESVKYTIALMDGISLYGRVLKLELRTGMESEENPYINALALHHRSMSCPANMQSSSRFGNFSGNFYDGFPHGESGDWRKRKVDDLDDRAPGRIRSSGYSSSHGRDNRYDRNDRQRDMYILESSRDRYNDKTRSNINTSDYRDPLYRGERMGPVFDNWNKPVPQMPMHLYPTQGIHPPPPPPLHEHSQLPYRHDSNLNHIRNTLGYPTFQKSWSGHH